MGTRPGLTGHVPKLLASRSILGFPVAKQSLNNLIWENHFSQSRTIFMHEFKKFGKKLFTMSVVGMTMVWSVGLSAFVPAGVAAASCPELVAGDLFKVPTVKGNPATTAVYLLTSDMKRLYFPKSEVFESWYGSFSNVQVKEIPASCLDSYDLAGGVNYRPGSRLLKTPLSPTIWAVAPGNMKVKVTSPDVLAATYGSNWTSMVTDFSDQWFSNLSSASGELSKLHDGQLVKKANDATVYYVWNGMLKKVDGTLQSFVSKDVRTVSDATFNALSIDSTNVTPATVVANPSQRTGSTGTVTPATGGNLSVSLAADTPVQPAGGLADGTAYNKMLKVSLRAGNKEVKVSGLTVTRTGLIANTYVSGVSVWDSAGYRKGDVMTSISSDNKVVIGFANNPIVIAAGSTEVVTVAFNIDAAAQSGSVGATIAAKTDIATNAAAVEGSFPVAGNVMSIVDGSTSLATFTVTSTAVGGNTTSGAAANVSVGDTREIGKFKFTETSGRNDLQVKSMIFFLEGTAKDKDFTNFEVLGHDNSVLGKTEYSGNRFVTVKFDSAYVVPKSQNRTVSLRAKVADGSGNYLRVQLQNDSDVEVTDAALGYSLLPTAFTGGGANDGYFKIREGALSISKNTASKSGNVSAGATGVELAKFDVTAVGEDIEIRKLGLSIATSGPNVGMPLSGNVSLVTDSGDTLLTLTASSVADALYTGGSQRSLSLYWVVPSGQTKTLRVVGDISSNATSTGYTVSIGNAYVRRMSSLNYVDNQPSSSNSGTSGNLVSVQATNLTLSKDSTLSNRYVTPGSKGIALARFVAQAGSAEGIRLTSFTVSNNGTASAASVVKNLEIWSGSTLANLAKIGTTISTAATSSNTFTFDSLVPANEMRYVEVRGDVDSTMTSGHSLVMSASSTNYIGASTGNSATLSDANAVLGQTMTAQAVNVIISAATDSTTVSAIRTPSTAAVQLGKWKVEAQNEAVTLNKLTFHVIRPDATRTVRTDAAEFGTLYLYDSTNMTTPLASGSYVPGTNNGYVRFTKDAMLSISADQTKYLVLMGTINGSGVMNPATTSAFIINTTSTTNFEMLRASGGVVDAMNGQVDFGAAGQDLEDSVVTSTWYLFHNTAPVIAKQSVGSSLVIDTQSQIFKFTVTNPGDREMRLGTTTINVSANGLAAAGTSSGTIHSFALWEANTAGGLATQLATSSLVHNTNGSGVSAGTSCLAGGVTAVAGAGVQNCVNATTSSLNLAFGQMSDTDFGNLFSNLTIPAGGSRTFVLVADTSAALAGKSTGSVSVTAKLDGATGFSTGNATHEGYWADGVVQYFYTPANGGSENTVPYSASDSYDVAGDTLSKTI